MHVVVHHRVIDREKFLATDPQDIAGNAPPGVAGASLPTCSRRVRRRLPVGDGSHSTRFATISIRPRAGSVRTRTSRSTRSLRSAFRSQRDAELQFEEEAVRRPPPHVGQKRSSSSRSGTSASDSSTRSASSSASVAVIGFGTATQTSPAAFAAVTPFGESSNAIPSSGSQARDGRALRGRDPGAASPVRCRRLRRRSRRGLRGGRGGRGGARSSRRRCCSRLLSSSRAALLRRSSPPRRAGAPRDR